MTRIFDLKNKDARHLTVVSSRWTMMAGVLSTILFLVFTIHCSLITVSAQTTEWTYQGRLLDNSLPPTANYDFEFSLWRELVAGTQIGTTQTVTGVAVTNGIFTVRLDFGNILSTENLFLQIAVRPAGGGAFMTLAPRQTVTAAPRSIISNKAVLAEVASSADSLSPTCNLCVLDGQILSVSGSKVTGTVANATSAVTANNVTGVVGVSNGGTGSSTQNFVDLLTNQTVGGNKSFTGILSGNGSGLTNVPGTLKWNNVTGTSQQALANNGYLANNNDEVTITLPVGPAIGDIVRVAGSGVHGWKIAQNGGQVIYLGNIFPPDNVNWTRLTDPLIEDYYRDVASSADGTKLAACASPGYLHTSTDSGATWTEHADIRYWASIASSSDGTKLVAVDGLAGDGEIYTSSDSGVTWVPRTAGSAVGEWSAVASSANGNLLVAVEDNGFVYTSPNSGVTWFQRESQRAWSAVDSSADGTKLIAAVAGGRLYTSTDAGQTWTARESNRNWNSVASSADGIKLVAVDAGGATGGRIYTSSDSGVTWTPRESSRHWSAVASSGDGTRLVAADGSGGYPGRIYVSKDSGRFWSAQDVDRNWVSVASSVDGTKLLAVVQAPDKIYKSPAPLPPPYTSIGTAGYLIGNQFSSIELKYIGGGVFLPLSHSGSIIAN